MPCERVEVQRRAFYREVRVVNLIYRSTGGRYLGWEVSFPQPDITKLLVMVELREVLCTRRRCFLTLLLLGERPFVQ